MTYIELLFLLFIIYYYLYTTDTYVTVIFKRQHKMEAIQKTKLSIPKKYRRYYCKVCRIYANSDVQLNQHLEGIRHQHRKVISRSSETCKHCTLDENQCNLLFYVPAFIIIIITVFLTCRYCLVMFVNWPYMQLCVCTCVDI